MNQVEIKRRQAQAISAILTLLTVTVVSRAVGCNGAAYAAAAAEAFALLWLVIGGSLTETLGRLLRIRASRGQYKNAERLRRNTMVFQMSAGLIGSIVLFAGADWIAARVFRIQYAALILMILAPAVFLRTVSSVLLGYFQGEGSELPAAAAGILRQIFILGFGLLFGSILKDYGSRVSRLLVQENFMSMYGGAGIAIAVSATEVLIVLFLFLIYKGSKRRSREPYRLESGRTAESMGDSMRLLWSSRAVQWLTEILCFLPLPLGLVFLQKSAAEDVSSEYGAYLAGYGSLCGCLAVAVLFVLLPVCGRVAALLRKEEQRFARTVFQCGLHAGTVYGAFGAMFVTVLSDQLGGLICPEQAQLAGRMLRGGGLAVVLLPLALYFGRYLILTGGKVPVLGAAGAGTAVYAVMTAVLVNRDGIGALALVYAGLAGMGVVCILLGMSAMRQLRVRPDWLPVLALPAGAAAVSGLICMLLGRLLTPHLGNLVTVIVALVVGLALYWAVLILLRGFRETELDVIPGGGLIRALGQLFRVF